MKTNKLSLKETNKELVNSLGKVAREIYLEQNPHGYRKKTTKTKNKKRYNRKSKSNKGLDFFLLKYS